MVQPAANAAPHFRRIILQIVSKIGAAAKGETHAIGKFHGTRAAATPIGCLTVNIRLPGAAG